VYSDPLIVSRNQKFIMRI